MAALDIEMQQQGAEKSPSGNEEGRPSTPDEKAGLRERFLKRVRTVDNCRLIVTGLILLAAVLVFFLVVGLGAESRRYYVTPTERVATLVHYEAGGAVYCNASGAHVVVNESLHFEITRNRYRSGKRLIDAVATVDSLKAQGAPGLNWSSRVDSSNRTLIFWTGLYIPAPGSIRVTLDYEHSISLLVGFDPTQHSFPTSGPTPMTLLHRPGLHWGEQAQLFTITVKLPFPTVPFSPQNATSVNDTANSSIVTWTWTSSSPTPSYLEYLFYYPAVWSPTCPSHTWLDEQLEFAPSAEPLVFPMVEERSSRSMLETPAVVVLSVVLALTVVSLIPLIWFNREYIFVKKVSPVKEMYKQLQAALLIQGLFRLWKIRKKLRLKEAQKRKQRKLLEEEQKRRQKRARPVPPFQP